MKTFAVLVAILTIALGVLILAWIALWASILDPGLHGGEYWTALLGRLFRPRDIWQICVGGVLIYSGVITLIFTVRAKGDNDRSRLMTRNVIIITTALMMLFIVGSLYFSAIRW